MSRERSNLKRCSRGAVSPRKQRPDTAGRLQLALLGLALAVSFGAVAAMAQTAVKVPRPEEKDKAEKAVKKEQEKQAQRTSVIEFHGQQAFDEKLLRSALKEQITTIDNYGLTPARG